VIAFGAGRSGESRTCCQSRLLAISRFALPSSDTSRMAICSPSHGFLNVLSLLAPQEKGGYEFCTTCILHY
jgi:hypothetical protein